MRFQQFLGNAARGEALGSGLGALPVVVLEMLDHGPDIPGLHRWETPGKTGLGSRIPSLNPKSNPESQPLIINLDVPGFCCRESPGKMGLGISGGIDFPA